MVTFIRLGCQCAIISVGLVLNSAWETQAEWVLNNQGTDGRYRIFIFSNEGLRLRPVTADKFQHVAWPSAIRHGELVYVFASAYEDGGWRRIHRWKSSDRVSYEYDGVVFEASDEERFGIGPAHVMFDPSAEYPFTMYYLVRGRDGPGNEIRVATSKDGASWSRVGIAITKKIPFESGGLSVSYACKFEDRVFLFFHGYSRDLKRAVSLVAESKNGIDFTNRRVILKPDGFGTTIMAKSGKKTAEFNLRQPKVGVPLVLFNGKNRQVVTPIIVEGIKVLFDSILLDDYEPGIAVSIYKNKIELSYAKVRPDGSWIGIATGYGALGTVSAEYTSTFSAAHVSGPWQPLGEGLRFSPYFPEGEWSTENPEPISSHSKCTR